MRIQKYKPEEYHNQKDDQSGKYWNHDNKGFNYFDLLTFNQG